MTQKRWWINAGLATVLAGLAILAVGCEHDEYTLRMSVEGDVLVRSLEVQRVDGGDAQGQSKAPPQVAPELLALVGKAYVAKPEKKENAWIFTGRFTGKTPDDVGGSGRLLHYASDFGQAWMYAENFRGSDDPQEQVKEIYSRADVWVDIARGWLKQQAGKEEGFARVDALLGGEGRRDFKAILLYTWWEANQGNGTAFYPGTLAANVKVESADAKTDTPDLNGELMRLLSFSSRSTLFLIQRDYLDPKDLPVFYVLLSGKISDDTAFLNLLRKTLARKTGLAEESPVIQKLCVLLKDDEARSAAWTSVEAYIRTTEKFKAFREGWKAKAAAETQPANAPEEKNSSDEKIIKAYLNTISTDQISLFGPDSDMLEIHLALPVKPLVTNGQWNAETREIVWSGDLKDRDASRFYLPKNAAAIWVTTNDELQTKLFGKVALKDWELVNLILWENGLSAENRKAWDALKKTLTPKTAFESIRTFYFPGEEKRAAEQSPALNTLYESLRPKSAAKTPAVDSVDSGN